MLSRHSAGICWTNGYCLGFTGTDGQRRSRKDWSPREEARAGQRLALHLPGQSLFLSTPRASLHAFSSEHEGSQSPPLLGALMQPPSGLWIYCAKTQVRLGMPSLASLCWLPMAHQIKSRPAASLPATGVRVVTGGLGSTVGPWV